VKENEGKKEEMKDIITESNEIHHVIMGQRIFGDSKELSCSQSCLIGI
jgi:hypothetical protein